MATFNLPAQARSSGTLSVPAGGVTIPANAHQASVQYVMPIDAERADTNARIEYSIDISTNDGVSWKPYLQAGWDGGNGLSPKGSTVQNAPPRAALEADFFQSQAGNLVRITTHAFTPMTIGLTVTVT